MKVSVKQFAVDCGVSRQMMYGYIADGDVEKVGRGIDNTTDRNRAFLQKMIKKQRREGKEVSHSVTRDGDNIVETKVTRKKPRGLPKEETVAKSPIGVDGEGKRTIKVEPVFSEDEDKGDPPLTRLEKINLKLNEVKLAKILGRIVAVDIVAEILQTLPKLMASRHHTHISDIIDELGAEFKIGANRKRALKEAAVERTNHDSSDALKSAEIHIDSLIESYSAKKGM